MWQTSFGPQPAAMRLDDGTADGEPHSDTIFLGRKKGIKNTIRMLRFPALS